MNATDVINRYDNPKYRYVFTIKVSDGCPDGVKYLKIFGDDATSILGGLECNDFKKFLDQWVIHFEFKF